MKIGVITKPNSKGQVVIPKDMRNALNITSDVVLNLVLIGNGIYIHPVIGVLTKSDTDSSYLKLLKKTKGAWTDKNWQKLSKNRSLLELKASRSRKTSW